MKRNIITTKDGSKTIQIEDWNEQYHSIHGAVNEANHVFLRHGLHYFIDTFAVNKQTLSILEIGFGTGLNAFLTLIEAEKLQLKINYTGVEAYPVSSQEIQDLNYVETVAPHYESYFEQLHTEPWDYGTCISPYFTLKKEQRFFEDINVCDTFDIIYFDAFGARVQPELWTEAIFKNMYRALRYQGVLVTYAAKGSVRRAMNTVGFLVERLQGPPGKRHMLRAVKR